MSGRAYHESRWFGIIFAIVFTGFMAVFAIMLFSGSHEGWVRMRVSVVGPTCHGQVVLRDGQNELIGAKRVTPTLDGCTATMHVYDPGTLDLVSVSFNGRETVHSWSWLRHHEYRVTVAEP